ncbi:MAG: TrmB family transcriptional regulator [Acidobacteriota bacterium]
MDSAVAWLTILAYPTLTAYCQNYVVNVKVVVAATTLSRMVACMIVSALRELGFTQHEALVYIDLVQRGEQTGYEIANSTGIARANVYSVLASLVDKGFAQKTSSDPARFVAVAPDELVSNISRSMDRSARTILDNLKPEQPEQNAIVSLDGEENILNKLLNMIGAATSTIYLSMTHTDLEMVLDALIEARNRRIKVVIITSTSLSIPEILTYVGEPSGSWAASEGRPLRIIVDSDLMLSGEMGRGKLSRGLFSHNETMVMMARQSFIHEIVLAEIRHHFHKELDSLFGPDFGVIRDKIQTLNVSQGTLLL